MCEYECVISDREMSQIASACVPVLSKVSRYCQEYCELESVDFENGTRYYTCGFLRESRPESDADEYQKPETVKSSFCPLVIVGVAIINVDFRIPAPCRLLVPDRRHSSSIQRTLNDARGDSFQRKGQYEGKGLT